MPTAVDWSKLSDDQRLHAFRLDQFLRMGFDIEQAETLANSAISWHEVYRLRGDGCPHELVLRILL